MTVDDVHPVQEGDQEVLVEGPEVQGGGHLTALLGDHRPVLKEDHLVALDKDLLVPRGVLLALKGDQTVLQGDLPVVAHVESPQAQAKEIGNFNIGLYKECAWVLKAAMTLHKY